MRSDAHHLQTPLNQQKIILHEVDCCVLVQAFLGEMGPYVIVL